MTIDLGRLTRDVTDDFCSAFSTDADYRGGFARLVAVTLPEAVDPTDERVIAIVEKCKADAQLPWTPKPVPTPEQIRAAVCEHGGVGHAEADSNTRELVTTEGPAYLRCRGCCEVLLRSGDVYRSLERWHGLPTCGPIEVTSTRVVWITDQHDNGALSGTGVWEMLTRFERVTDKAGAA